jgi:putative hemolysin
MRADQARAAGQFYSEDEYDLGRCAPRGGGLLELGGPACIATIAAARR